MTPLPLDRLRFGWRSHLSALWWLGLLYRRPHALRVALEALPKTSAIVAGSVLLANAVLYIVAIHIFFWTANILDISGSAIAIGIGVIAGITGGIGPGFGAGIGVAIALGLAGAITTAIAEVVGVGTAGGVGPGIAFGVAGGITGATAFAISGSVNFGIARGIVFAIGFGIAFGIAFAAFRGILFGVDFAIGFGIAILRAYYLPLHAAFVWPVPRAHWYRFHPVAWDDLCGMPFPGLDRLLVAFVEYAEEAGRREIDRLIDNYPSQRMLALRARAIVLGREMGREPNLAVLDAAAARLPQGERGFLADVPKLRDMIAGIASLQRRLETVHRAFLREPLAQALRTHIENFRHQVAGFREPLASEFRAAGAQWLAVADGQWREAEALIRREPIAQVFRAGDPVDRTQEAFVPRLEVIGDLEAQLTLAAGCPGLVLYGRRVPANRPCLKISTLSFPPRSGWRPFRCRTRRPSRRSVISHDSSWRS